MSNILRHNQIYFFKQLSLISRQKIDYVTEKSDPNYNMSTTIIHYYLITSKIITNNNDISSIEKVTVDG